MVELKKEGMVIKKGVFPLGLLILTILALMAPINIKAQTNDTLRKKTVKEFDFADYNKDGFITYKELNDVINEKFDGNTSFSSLDVYRLTLYFKNQYLPNELMAEVVEKSAFEEDSLKEREEEKPSFLDKYFTVGAELTGLFQASSRLYKAKYDGPVSLSAKAHDEKLTLFTIPVVCTPWKGILLLSLVMAMELAMGPELQRIRRLYTGFPPANPIF